jgi:hypothetical protein
MGDRTANLLQCECLPLAQSGHAEPSGAEAFKCDDVNAELHFYDTGHFALETHAHEIGAAVRKFLDANLSQQAAR